VIGGDSMKRRTFIPCLNKQRKLYNFSIGSLIGCAIAMVLVVPSKGVLWGLGAGAVGFVFGNWLSNSLYTGAFQRFLYWNLPYARDWLSRNISESCEKEEL
jgi:hypothetical protein